MTLYHIQMIDPTGARHDIKSLRLADIRAVPADDWQAGLDAALTTLSGRVRRHESCRRSADQVIEEIFRSVRAGGPDSAGGDASPGE